jgi:hypothetical protein
MAKDKKAKDKKTGDEEGDEHEECLEKQVEKLTNIVEALVTSTGEAQANFDKKFKDVEAKEIKAKDLANTLVAKKDFTVEECVNRTKILNIVETRLLTRLASVRKEKEELVATISHKE